MSAHHQPLPFQWNLLAGAVAGVTELCVLFPLDVVKTRFQLQVGKGGADGYTSMLDCFRKIIRREGFWSLYRGLLPPILVETPKRAIKFSANEFYGGWLRRTLTADGRMTQSLSVATGVLAGMTEAVVIVPFELVKIRLQDPKNRGVYKNTFDCAAKILRQEGLAAFYKGIESTLWRNGVWNGGYFGCIHFVRGALPQPKTSTQESWRNFAAGFVGGTFGTMLNTPFDVVKTRIQNQGSMLTASGAPKYHWTLPGLATIAREEGLAALWKGFVPKVVRLGPGGGILLVVFDVVSDLIRTRVLV
eukprot:Unigene3113_Nuclearia_a/m.9553 Unigene3113_Nuclearia_a/g.9553  ORF Unigene3113_Nuclearia_a/g.9553 Unigene3113_Nuclearia_a/m.9553 type:complete len:303 (-) Unigene3113_Nuclearia_a:242-1150(-)